MRPGSGGKGQGKEKRMPLGTYMKRFQGEKQCAEYMASLRWQKGFGCSNCGHTHAYRLSNGRYQCARCRRQTSVTAGTVLHRSHVRLTTWFLAFYLVCFDKRSISAVQLSSQIGVSYKTAWYMLKRIRMAMGQRDGGHKLNGTIEFDDAYFGGPTVGKRGRGTGKAKVFVALSLDGQGRPGYLKMQVTKNIKQASVKKFAQKCFSDDCVVKSDGYSSYIETIPKFV